LDGRAALAEAGADSNSVANTELGGAPVLERIASRIRADALAASTVEWSGP